MTMKLISLQVYDPRNSPFAAKAARTRVTTIECDLDGECPLLKAGQCIHVSMFERCPHGSTSILNGPTSRASSYRQWIDDHVAAITARAGRTLTTPKQAVHKLTKIGDLIWVPHSFADLNTSVPFLRHSSLFVGGMPFIQSSDWTVENVLKIIRFKPQVMMGGEITDYQKKSVPLFLEHLRDFDSAMWQQVVAVLPQHDTAPNYVGRRAILKTLKPGISWSTKHDKYPVQWTWDGEKARTASETAYEKTWGKIPAASVSVEVTPADDAEVVVQDNSWVIPTTVIID